MGFDIANLNWVETVWLLVSGAGLYFGWTNLRESKLDRARARPRRTACVRHGSWWPTAMYSAIVFG